MREGCISSGSPFAANSATSAARIIEDPVIGGTAPPLKRGERKVLVAGTGEEVDKGTCTVVGSLCI